MGLFTHREIWGSWGARAAFAAAMILAPRGIPDARGAAVNLVTPATTTDPPTFNLNSSQASAMSGLFGSCMGLSVGGDISSGVSQIGNAIANPMSATATSLQAGLGGGYGSLTCPSDQPPDNNGGQDCNLYYNGNNFDPTAAASLKAPYLTAEQGVTCKRGKFQAIQSEITCLNQSQNNLMNLINSQLGAYQQNIQKMDQDYMTLKNIEQDRTTQKDQVSKRLNGDQSNGTPGLLAMQQKLSAMVDDMNGAGVAGGGGGNNGGDNGGDNGNGAAGGNNPQTFINGANLTPGGIPGDQALIDGLHNESNILQSQIKNRTMAVTDQCFSTSTTTVSYKCDIQGTPCSTEQYLLKIYGDKLLLDSAGHYNPNDPNLQQQSTTGVQQLQTILTNIFGASSSNTQVAFPDLTGGAPNALPSAVVNDENKLLTVFTPQDVANQFGGQLQALNLPGFNIYNFVMANFQQCYSYAQSEVSLEQTPARSDSPIYQAVYKLNQDRIKVGNAMNAQLKQYTETYSQALDALTGNHFPIDTTACDAATVENKLKCLTDMQTNATGLLAGTTPNSSITLFFNAINPADVIQFQCAGMDGCVTALQAVSTNLDSEIVRLGAVEKAYVQQANQNIDNYTIYLAQNLSRASQMEGMAKDKLNQLLQAAGLQSFNPGNVQSASFEPDSNNGGIYKVPTNLLGIIGSKMSPPLLDLTGQSGGGGGDTLSSLSSEIAQAQNDENTKDSTIQSALAQIDQKAASCKSQLQQQLANQIGEDAGKMSACFQNQRWCQNTGNAQSMADIVNGLGLNVQAEQISNIDALEEGADCSNVGAAIQDAQNAVTTARTTLKGDCINDGKGNWNPNNTSNSDPTACTGDLSNLNTAQANLTTANQQNTQDVSQVGICSQVSGQLKRDAASVNDAFGGSDSSGSTQ